LYLNRRFAGNIAIHGWDGPWGFGDFDAAPGFASFAPLYREWSRLMHSPEVARRLTRPVAAALRKIESDLYAIAAKIYVQELKSWRQVGILTIDGTLIEWKEVWSAEPHAQQRVAARHAGRAREVR
jgi:hypothetical protein